MPNRGKRKSSTILVVEDDESIRATMAATLEHEGYSVLLAVSGNHTLSKLKSHAVNLIISDIQMPDGDGFALLEELRKQKESPPVIFVSAHPISSKQVKDMGAIDLVKKPFEIDVLIDLVSRTVEAKSA